MTPVVDATDQLVKRIALVAAGFGALAALWMGSKAGLSGALSSVVGTAVGVGNLWALAKLLTKIVDRNADSSRGRAMALLVLKTLGLFVLVGVLVHSGWLKNGPFVAGITACVLAIPVGALLEGSGESLEGKRRDDKSDRGDDQG